MRDNTRLLSKSTFPWFALLISVKSELLNQISNATARHICITNALCFSRFSDSANQGNGDVIHCHKDAQP